MIVGKIFSTLKIIYLRLQKTKTGKNCIEIPKCILCLVCLHCIIIVYSAHNLTLFAFSAHTKTDPGNTKFKMMFFQLFTKKIIEIRAVEKLQFVIMLVKSNHLECSFHSHPKSHSMLVLQPLYKPQRTVMR